MDEATVDVVIPARNEERTIARLISIFRLHPAIGQIIVVVDKDTGDLTAQMAETAIGDFSKGWLLTPNVAGKGQCVREGLKEVTSKYVLFCDSDITGLTLDHISLLLGNAILDNPFMTIGVPDVPRNYPTERLFAWRWVSGQRCVPTSLVRPLYLHGYLMETQINQAAQHARLPVNFEWLTGMQSSYYMSVKRIEEMERDAIFGRAHGIL
jgi:glycosyltransferase involved in cell wall biosynthesis